MNHVIDEEELFQLLEKQFDFLEYLQNNELKFKSLKMLSINYSEDKDRTRLFTFESVCKLLIDDGDPLWRKKRSSLMDPRMKSILMVVDRKNNIMFILLFGERIIKKGAKVIDPLPAEIVPTDSEVDDIKEGGSAFAWDECSDRYVLTEF